MTVTLMVIFGFIACALLLRVLARGEADRERVRTSNRGLRAPRAMMDE